MTTEAAAATETKKTAKRIYVVTPKGGTAQEFVRASNTAQALGFVVRNAYDVRMATAEDTIGISRDDIKDAVETAEPAGGAS